MRPSNKGLAARNAALIHGIGQTWDEAPGHGAADSRQPLVGVDATYPTVAFATIQSQYGGEAELRAGEVHPATRSRFYSSIFDDGGVLQATLKAALLE